MKLIFRLLLVGVQNLKPAELYQNVLQLFFSFSQFIFSLSRAYYGSARISIKHFVLFLNRLVCIHIVYIWLQTYERFLTKYHTIGIHDKVNTVIKLLLSLYYCIMYLMHCIAAVLLLL